MTGVAAVVVVELLGDPEPHEARTRPAAAMTPSRRRRRLVAAVR
jgi:hypothetical protein